MSLAVSCLVANVAPAETELRLICFASVWMVLDCREIKSDSAKLQRELKVFITTRVHTGMHTFLFIYLFSACKRASSWSTDGVCGQIFNESVANSWASSLGARSQKSLILDRRNESQLKLVTFPPKDITATGDVRKREGGLAAIHFVWYFELNWKW